ncbi:MAG: hypothetical protein V2A54_02990 [Bacteroidota bacterium]
MYLSLFLMKGKRNYFATIFIMTLLLGGCSGWFSGMRYPDLRKIPVNAQRADDSNHMLQAQKMKILHALKFVEKAEEIIWMNPLSIVMKSNTASHPGVFMKIKKKTLSLKHKLSVASQLRKMVEKQNQPMGNQVLLAILLGIFIISFILLAINIKDIPGFGCALWIIGFLFIMIIIFALMYRD